MSLRRKKSLSIVLLGLVLLLFTFSLQRVKFGDSNRKSIDAAGSDFNLDSPKNASLLPKTSTFLRESKLIYDSQDVNNHESQETRDSLQIIPLQNHAKASLSRVKHYKEKTTVSRGE